MVKNAPILDFHCVAGKLKWILGIIVIKATVASAAASESQSKPLKTPRELVHSVPRCATVSLSEFQFSPESTETAGDSDYRDPVVFHLGRSC